MNPLAANTDRSPIILVHGAANSSSVWTFWEQELIANGWSTHAINLRGHGAVAGVDLSQTSMDDYAGDVIALAGQLKDLPVLIGWSMGGLVAMMAAAEGKAAACITLAPSMQRAAPTPLSSCATVSLRRRSTASRAVTQRSSQQCRTLT